MIQNNVDIKELVQDNYVVPESIFDRKRTKTSHFMINAIFSNNTIMATEYFVNAFLDDEAYTHSIKQPVFVLFRHIDGDVRWETLLQKMRSKKEYVLDYITGEKDGFTLVMVVFQVPEVYVADFIRFKNGQYSKFSDDYRKFFSRYLANNKAQPVESTLWRIINKSEELKKELIAYFTIHSKRPTSFSSEDELWGQPEPKFENYNHE